MNYSRADMQAFEQSLSGQLDKKYADKLGRNQKSAKIQKRASADKKCTSCGTTNTPVWRWGGEAKEVLLCNACSLRIRRSATKPLRSKSPNDVPSQKQSPAPHGADSESPTCDRPKSEGEADALRHQLLLCVEFHLSLEKARLLGSREAPRVADEWASSQRMGNYGSSYGRVAAPVPLHLCPEYAPNPYALPPGYSMPDPGQFAAQLSPYSDTGLLRML